MKFLKIIVLVFLLILFNTTNVFGLDSFFKDDYINFLRTDTWFTFEEKNPFFLSSVNYRKYDWCLELDYNIAYWQDEFTYVHLEYFDRDEESHYYDNTMTRLQMSYLFENGFFLQTGYILHDGKWGPGEKNDYFFISPGYRWSLGNNDYVAVSIEYEYDGLTHWEGLHKSFQYRGISQYNLDVQKTFNRLKAMGNIMHEKNDVWDWEYTYLDLLFRYKVNDSLVYGLNIDTTINENDLKVENGFTWTGKKVIIDGSYKTVSGEPGYFENDSIMFKVTDHFKTGLEYLKYYDYDTPIIKACYSKNNSDFSLKYYIDGYVDSESSVMLQFQRNF